MKASLRGFATVALTLACGMAFPADDDLLAWWRFDEGEGTRTTDAATDTTDRVHRPTWAGGSHGTGLAFDGAGTWVTRPAAHAPQLPGDFTTEAWIAVREYPGGWTPIVNQHRCPEAGFFFGLDQSGAFGLHVSVDGEWRVCNVDAPLPEGKWLHVAGVYSAESGVRVYVNGQVRGQLEVTGRVPTAGNMDLLIGKHNHGPTAFDGIIDEVKLYGRALSSDEVARTYADGVPDRQPEFPERREQSRVDSRLEAWWRFAEGQGSETVDAVTGATDAVHHAVWVAGSTNTGLLFDGRESSVVRSAADAPLLTPDFAIEAWVAVREYPSEWTPIINQHEYPTAGFFFGLNESGFFGLHVSVGGQWHTCNSDITLPKNRWLHLAGMYRSDSGIRLYINGQLTGQLHVSGTVPTAEKVDLLIGKHNHTPTVFDGIIDEVRIYNRALSAEQLIIIGAAGAPKGEPEFPEARGGT